MYPLYIAALLTPTIQYFLAAMLVPGEPDEVLSWRDFYFSVRRRFFVGLCVLGLAGLFSNTALLGMPLQHPARLGQVGIFVIGLFGVLSSNPRVHAGLAVMSLIAVVAFGIVVLANPASLV